MCEVCDVFMFDSLSFMHKQCSIMPSKVDMCLRAVGKPSKRVPTGGAERVPTGGGKRVCLRGVWQRPLSVQFTPRPHMCPLRARAISTCRCYVPRVSYIHVVGT